MNLAYESVVQGRQVKGYVPGTRICLVQPEVRCRPHGLGILDRVLFVCHRVNL